MWYSVLASELRILVTEFDYTACYCEENIWRLIRHVGVGSVARKVIWISSLTGVCPLWHQRAAAAPDQPVWWDYHVVLLVQTDVWSVWDLDTTLALPVPAEEYLAQTFKGVGSVEPLFRVMDADYYFEKFSSDRSHMRDEQSGWRAEPPPWEPIYTAPSTFFEMLDFNSDLHGCRLSLPQLQRLIRV
jgi:hypothetical protein